MSQEVLDFTLDRIAEYVGKSHLSEVGIILHGGEPLLLGHRRFVEMAAQIRRRLGDESHLTLQTNATLIDSEWLRIFEDHRVRVGISIDGTPASHDRYRVDHRGLGSYDKTLRGLRLVQKSAPHLFAGVLCVIDLDANPGEVYRHFRSMNVSEMDFLLPDACHENPQSGYGAAPLYGEWLCRVYDEWLREDDPAVRIRSFESLMRSFLGFTSITDAFGGSPLGYVIVETDGMYGALDSFRAIGSGLANTGLDVFQSSIADVLQTPIIREMRRGRPGISKTCSVCSFGVPCGGGYLPHRFKAHNRFDNPSVYCWDLFYLCSHIQETLNGPTSRHSNALSNRFTVTPELVL